MNNKINWLVFIQLIVIGLMGLSAQNLYSVDDFPNTLSYSIDRGFYQQPFDTELAVDTTNAIIKYTLDGSDPSSSATARTASAPVTIRIDPDDKTGRFIAPAVCLRAVGYDGTKQITRVMTHTYLFIDRVIALSPDGVRPGTQWPLPNNSGSNQYIDYGMDPQVYNDSRYKDRMIDGLLAIPTISLVTDLKNLFDPGTGIYMNAFGRGLDWERPASVELLNPDGSDGFKFFRHDAEHTMFLQEGAIPGAGIDRTGPYPAGNTKSEFNPQWLHQQLTNHPEYILRYTDFVYQFFFNDGLLTPAPVINRIQERRKQIEVAIIAESARWGDSKVTQPRTYGDLFLQISNEFLASGQEKLTDSLMMLLI